MTVAKSRTHDTCRVHVDFGNRQLGDRFNNEVRANITPEQLVQLLLLRRQRVLVGRPCQFFFGQPEPDVEGVGAKRHLLCDPHFKGAVELAIESKGLLGRIESALALENREIQPLDRVGHRQPLRVQVLLLDSRRRAGTVDSQPDSKQLRNRLRNLGGEVVGQLPGHADVGVRGWNRPDTRELAKRALREREVDWRQQLRGLTLNVEDRQAMRAGDFDIFVRFLELKGGGLNLPIVFDRQLNGSIERQALGNRHWCRLSGRDRRHQRQDEAQAFNMLLHGILTTFLKLAF